MEAFLTISRFSKEAGGRREGRREGVENEVSLGARSQSMVDHDKEFALCSQHGGSYCVFCVAKRRGIIDHSGCSGEDRQCRSREKLEDYLVC